MNRWYILSSQLVAGDGDLLGVDHDDVVAGIDVRGELGLCLPRRRRASSVDRRPRVLPVASTTYQSRFTLSGLALNVFISGDSEAPAPGRGQAAKKGAGGVADAAAAGNPADSPGLRGC